MMTEAIGILGGTFDPIHYGHLRPALEVAETLGLSHIRLIPNSIPPHRPQPIATVEQRLTMLKLAVEGHPRFQVDDRELNRQGESYTIDTLVDLRDEFPDKALYLLVGTDAFLHIQTWHRWHELLEFTHIVVMQRPGELPVMNEQTQAWYQQHLADKESSILLCGKIWPIAVTQLMVSATQIRKTIADKCNPQFLLPDAVIGFINQASLYGVE